MTPSWWTVSGCLNGSARAAEAKIPSRPLPSAVPQYRPLPRTVYFPSLSLSLSLSLSTYTRELTRFESPQVERERGNAQYVRTADVRGRDANF